MFKKLSPNLMVEDVSQTLDFFETVLGFTRVMTLPEQAPFAWGLVQQGGVEVMFQSRESFDEEVPAFKNREVGGTLVFYVEVDDIEALYVSLRPRVSVFKELATAFYGMREFTIKDPNGYLFTFAQPVQE